MKCPHTLNSLHSADSLRATTRTQPRVERSVRRDRGHDLPPEPIRSLSTQSLIVGRLAAPPFAAARRASVLVLLAFLVASSASAQAFKKGVRVSATNVDTTGVGLDVDIYIEMFTTNGSAVTSSLGNSAAPAIDWGDGITVGNTPVGYDFGGAVGTDPGTGNPIYRFRGTFSHTYPDLDPRNITVASGCCSIVGSATFAGYHRTTHSSTIVKHYGYFTWPTTPNTPISTTTTTTNTWNQTTGSNVPPRTVNSLGLSLDLGTYAGSPIRPFNNTSTTYNSTQTSFQSTWSTGGPRPNDHTTFKTADNTTNYYGTGFGSTPGFTNTILVPDVIFADGFESGNTLAWN